MQVCESRCGSSVLLCVSRAGRRDKWESMHGSSQARRPPARKGHCETAVGWRLHQVLARASIRPQPTLWLLRPDWPQKTVQHPVFFSQFPIKKVDGTVTHTTDTSRQRQGRYLLELPNRQFLAFYHCERQLQHSMGFRFEEPCTLTSQQQLYRCTKVCLLLCTALCN